MSALLELEDVRAGYGSHAILHGVSFAVEEGSYAALLGLNGAGKSVTLRTISGLLKPWSGTIRFDGADIARMEPEDRVRLGIAHVPQGRMVFGSLTVEENLRLGAAVLRDGARRRAAEERVFETFPILRDRRRQTAGTLSGGEQEMLAVGRALMSAPRMILVDEPSAGLAPVAIERLFGILSQVNKTGVTILMVEQNTAFTLKIADDVMVLQKGEVVLSSPVRAIKDARALLDLLGVGALTRKTVAATARRRATPAAKKKQAPRKRTAARPRRAAAPGAGGTVRRTGGGTARTGNKARSRTRTTR